MSSSLNDEKEEKSEKFEVDHANLLRHRARLPTITRYPPPKTTLAAILMLIGGITFLISGSVVYFGDSDQGRGLPMFILGIICKFCSTCPICHKTGL